MHRADDMGAVFAVAGCAMNHYKRDISIAKTRILEGGQVVRTAQGPIEYSTHGNGSPVFYIHGAGGGHDMGRLIAGRIGDDFYWICPSRFGYLRSPIPEEATFEAQADTYAALLDYLDIDKAAIIGLSIGGPSALLFALRHPSRCSALVLQSAITKTVAKRPKADWFYNMIFSSDFIYWSVSHAFKNFLVKKFGVDPSVLENLTHDENKGLEEGLHIFHPASKRYPGILNDQKATISDKQYDLHRINIPTLILHALDDGLVDYDFARYAHKHIPHSESIAFPSGGHFLLGQEKQYRKAVVRFLKAHL